MALTLLLGGPALEFYVFGLIGREIGVGNALLATLLTAGVGIALVRRQGLGLLRRMAQEADAGRAPVAEVIEGVLLAIAGIFLFLPGFVTDSLGILLLIPPLRTALARLPLSGVVIRNVGRTGTRQGSRSGSQTGPEIIEAESWTVVEEPSDGTDKDGSKRGDPPLS